MKRLIIVLLLLSSSSFAAPARVTIVSGDAKLSALLWRPEGTGPFPAILMNHGSGRTAEDLQRFGPYEQNAEALGPVFARHGYVFLYLFRRGVGPSAGQGTNAIDLMNAAHSRDARDAVQIDLLEHREMSDASAALLYLRQLRDVDAHRIGVVGHSFGGSLTLLMAARDPEIRAIVLFSAAGYSWNRSPALRERLLDAVRTMRAAAMFVHTANDYSLSGEPLAGELERLGRPHEIRIYPAFGHSADEGHDFIHGGVSLWEREVFAFLDRYTKERKESACNWSEGLLWSSSRRSSSRPPPAAAKSTARSRSPARTRS